MDPQGLPNDIKFGPVKWLTILKEALTRVGTWIVNNLGERLRQLLRHRIIVLVTSAPAAICQCQTRDYGKEYCSSSENGKNGPSVSGALLRTAHPGPLTIIMLCRNIQLKQIIANMEGQWTKMHFKWHLYMYMHLFLLTYLLDAFTYFGNLSMFKRSWHMEISFSCSHSDTMGQKYLGIKIWPS